VAWHRNISVALSVLLLASIAGWAGGAAVAAALSESAAPAAGSEPELESESEAASAARDRLPARFHEYETRRFVVFSDAEPGWTRRQAEQLERAYHQFDRFCRRLAVRPQPLRHKLVAVAFRSRNDYQQFARRHDDVRDAALAGYYSPRHQRVVFYHVESNPSLTEARGQLDDMHDQIRDIESQARDALRTGKHEQASALRELRTRYQRHLRDQRKLVDEFALQAGASTIVHEAVHQLAFHMELQSPRIEYPLWISEGLATSFETDDPSVAFGPDHEYAPRRLQFEELLTSDKLIPLPMLVRLAHDEVEDEQRSAVYPQVYALFTWLCRFRRAELREYFDAMLGEPEGRPTADRHHELFVEAFGKPEALERTWLKYERNR
jgi:hypothetical protein